MKREGALWAIASSDSISRKNLQWLTRIIHHLIKNTGICVNLMTISLENTLKLGGAKRVILWLTM